MSEVGAPAGRWRRLAAWGVHLFTASSAPAGLLAILAADRGDAPAALGWMAYTIAVDSIDGTMARAVGVKQVLPLIDGTLLDNVVDYVTYVIAPAYFLVRFDLLPADLAAPIACCPVLASALGFCRTDAKTTDHFFTGFPSYWNIVVFYLYALGWAPLTNALWVVGLSAAVFVPVRYLYPSRTVTLRPLTIGFGLVWGVTVLYVLAHLSSAPHVLVVASLAYPVYYVALSLFLQFARATG